ncbi:MAG: DUF58 domain-containing protein [Bacteroidota bacterium]|nr:DUF58 domain-containing protein [Bacteroidota bacterium]MDX5504922.1 DUF58 domain-containing protein [Bacteroidota bacterium]
MLDTQSYKIHGIQNLEFFARQVVEGFITGLHRSPYHGFSVEFAEHRQYNQGESTRHIDWKLYGRTDKLFLKRFEEETNLRAQLILDVSGSMYYPKVKELTPQNLNKIGFSVMASAVLMDLLKRQRDAVGLSLVDDSLRWTAPAKGSAAHHRMLLAHLEEALVPPQKELRGTRLVEQLHLLAEKFPKRSMVMLFSDMLDRVEEEDALFEAFQHLRYNKHELILFHTFDAPTERDFDLGNRPLKLVDLETGEKIKLDPEDYRELYHEKMEERFRSLKLKCGQYGIDFMEADISKGFETVLLPFLLKRQKLF